MKTKVNQELLRYHVSHDMFCRSCEQVLDVTRAVSLDLLEGEKLLGTRVTCAACYDERKASDAQLAEKRGWTIAVLDGRELFGKGKR